MNTITEPDFRAISQTIAGDYYQVLFHDGLDREDEAYFMIQAQFDFPDGGECYFESHREELTGHNRQISASLSKNVLRITYGQQPTRNVEVRFSTTDDEYDALSCILTEMIPDILIGTES